jgi:hypothetical protein
MKYPPTRPPRAPIIKDLELTDLTFFANSYVFILIFILDKKIIKQGEMYIQKLFKNKINHNIIKY